MKGGRHIKISARKNARKIYVRQCPFCGRTPTSARAGKQYLILCNAVSGHGIWALAPAKELCIKRWNKRAKEVEP